MSDEVRFYEAIGRRKRAVARVRLYPGDGLIRINERALKEHFGRSRDRLDVTAPLTLTDTESSFNLSVRVMGGGITGQAQAIRHGVARALLLARPELRGTLRRAGFLTRDPREKERKKPGLKRARKAPQYTKR